MKFQLFDPADLKLSQKGLVLVSVPLVFGILFVAALYFLLSQAEQEARREAHSKQVIAAQQNIVTLFYDSGTTLAAYALGNKDPLAEKRLNQIVSGINTNIDLLTHLVKGDPRQTSNLDNLLSHSVRALSFINSSKTLIDERGRMALVGTGRIREQMRAVYWQVVEDALKIQNTQEEEDRNAEPARWWQLPVKQFLLVGVAANVLLALFLAKFFSEGTTRRLSVLMENTDRLAKKQELAPQLAGSDEIAQLDQTFHKMAEALRQTEQLRQAVVATVTHELRTPLASVQGYLELLGEGTFGVEIEGQARKGLEAAERSTNRLLKLINDLLSIDKLESGTLQMNFEEIDIQDVITRAVDETKVLAGQHGIELVVTPASSQLKADQERLVQVVINLISNAIKFSPSGSAVKIETEDLPQAVKVRVIDRGRGIPAQYHNAVFERFQQVDKTDARSKGGTGLGLSICKAIIGQHNGEIGVESEAGSGSTFWFSIPKSGDAGSS